MTEHYATRDEAIVAAVKAMDPGDEAWVHQEGCAAERDYQDRCTCEPLQLVRPAPPQPIGFRK